MSKNKIKRVNNVMLRLGSLLILLGMIFFILLDTELMLVITIAGQFILLNEFSKLYLVVFGRYEFEDED